MLEDVAIGGELPAELWSLVEEYRQLPMTWLGGNQGIITFISLFLCSPIFNLCFW